MRSLNIFCALLYLIVFGACGTTKLSEKGASVVLSKDQPAKNCKEVGGVEGGGFGYVSPTSAKNKMRENAADMGANYVVFEAVEKSGDYKAIGTAFKCP